MKSRGTEEAFYLSPCSLEKRGEEDAAALRVQRARSAKLGGRCVVFRASLFTLCFFFLAHPVRKKSKFEKPTMGISVGYQISVCIKISTRDVYLKCRFPSISLQSLFH